MFSPLIFWTSSPYWAKWSGHLDRMTCSISSRFAARSNTARPRFFSSPRESYVATTTCSRIRSSTSSEVVRFRVPTNWFMKFSGESTRYRNSPNTRRLTTWNSGSRNW